MRIPQNIPDHDSIDGFSLRDYRLIVAKLIKLLIRARSKYEPGFLTSKELSRWHLADIFNESRSAEALLEDAAAAYDHLWRVFIGPFGSGGVASDDPLSELKELVVQFAITTPPEALLSEIRKGTVVNWSQIAKWETLGRIRKWLDALPGEDERGKTASTAFPAITIMDRRTRTVLVRGKKKTLTDARFDVVSTLIKVFPDTLTKDQLVEQSRHSDAVNILKRIIEGDPDFRSAIKLAVSTGGGYGVQPIKVA